MPNPIADANISRQIDADSEILMWEGSNEEHFIGALAPYEVSVRRHPMLVKNLWVIGKEGFEIQLRPGDCIAIHEGKNPNETDAIAVLSTGEGVIAG